MNSDTERTTYLLKRYSAGNTSMDEEHELFGIIHNSKREEIEDQLVELIAEERPEAIDPNVWQPIIERITSGDGRPKVILIQRWMAAAVIAGVVLLGGYWLFLNSSKTGSVETAQTQGVVDAQPGREGAILTLGSGASILLDTLSDGALVNVSGGKVEKQQTGLQYNTNQDATGDEFELNTLTTPRGRTFAVMLADGTRVWLNSSSTIQYPVAFTGNTREVSITGEAYFEVAKNPSKKFLVHFGTNGNRRGVVEVLGTHFNVNSYGDEASVKISLIEGSVKVDADADAELTGTTTLQPGQQATLWRGEGRIGTNGFDEESVLAWKEGFFQFDNADVSVILRQMARWYDIDVKMEGDLKRKLGGRINRNQPLSSVLKVFDAKQIKYSFNGNQLTVHP